MATVGSLNLKMVVNPANWNKGLAGAAQSLDRLGRKMKAVNPAVGLGKLFGSVGKVSDNLLGPVKGLLSSIPLVGGAFGELPTTVGGFFSFVKGGMDVVKDMASDSERLGLSIGDLAASQILAGPASESMTRGLFKFNALVGEAASGSSEAQKKIAELGLTKATPESLAAKADFVAKSPNLNAAAEFDAKQFLQVGDMGEQLRTLMDRFQGTTDAAERARIAHSLFGKTGAELIPILMRGRGAMDTAAGAAKHLGMAFSSVEADQVRQAAKAMKETEKAVKGVQVQLAIQLAPFLKAAVDEFNNVMRSGTDMGENVTKAIGWVASAIGGVLDVVDVLRVGFKSLQIVIDLVIAGVFEALGLVGQAASLLPGNEWGAKYASQMKVASGSMYEGIEKTSREMSELMGRSRSKEAEALFDRIGSAARRSAAEVAALNRERTVPLGVPISDKTAEGVRAAPGRRFFNLEGGGVIIQDRAEKARRAAEALGKVNDAIARSVGAKNAGELFDRAKKGAEEMIPPGEKFARTLREINAMRKVGVPDALTAPLTLKATTDLISAMPTAEFKNAGAMLKDTASAYSAILKYQTQNSETPIERVRRVLEESATIHKQQLKAAEMIEKAIREGGPGLV